MINPINAQPSFTSNTYIADDDYRDNIDKLVRIVDVKDDFIDDYEDGDSFELSTKEQKTDKKNVAETAVSIVGAILIPVVVGRGIASQAEKLFPDATKFVTSNASKLTNKLSEKTGEIINDDKTIKYIKRPLEISKAGVSKFFNKYLKGSEKATTLQKTSGWLAGISVAPRILLADGNKDGVKDITQKSVSAYDSTLKNMGTLKTLLDIAV